jgi:hypothetical protein
VVAVRLGERLELTEFPMAKSSKASDAAGRRHPKPALA